MAGSRRWALLTNLGLGLAVTALAVCLAEGAARALMPAWTPTRADRTFWVYDPVLGWGHETKQRGRLDHPDFSIAVTNNSGGLRDDEYPLNRSPGKRRMLVLGDSFAWGFGVELEERFSEILERSYLEWEVINASVSGYGTDQQLLYYQHRGFEYRPDVVLLLFHPNDVENNAHDEQYWHTKPHFDLVEGKPMLAGHPVPEPGLRQRLTKALFARTWFLSRLYHTARFAIMELESLQKGGDDKDAPDSSVVGGDCDRRGHRITRALLLALHREVRRTPARFVVVSVPSPSGCIRALLDATLAPHGIPYLPLDDTFVTTAESVVFEHDSHWNATGHQVAAGAIDRFLIEVGVFAKSPADDDPQTSIANR